MCCPQPGLGALPLALVFWASTTFLLSYVTAALLGHVDLFIPYISDTGSELPERCVFGFMLALSALLGLGTMYVRYKQVHALLAASEASLHLLNYVGFLLGGFGCFGMTLIANFQKTSVISIHLLGAGLTFGPGSLYILVQTGLSYRMQPRFHGKGVLYARSLVGVWTLASFISLFISSVLMYDDLPGVDVARKMHWQPGEMGFMAHQVSAASEWSLAFSFIAFFLTYVKDFQKIQLRVHPILQSSHLYHYAHYDSREHARPSEQSPLLAGSI